ncbi:MAG: LPXTG cell wall anchor domain-containing protein, partial [Actinomycetota bacterium]|nr:LPXTG cell wall anchor domain-containing protein [Actinomycetota bacterium]
PAVAAGDHHVQVSGTGADGKPLVQRVKITVAGASGGNNLPKTGADSTTPIAQIGAGAVAAGGLLLLVAKKRRSSVKTAA